MEIYLLLVPAAAFLIWGLCLVFKSTKSGRTYRDSSIDLDTKKRIDDLHKMQTHNFWRDFGK
jgi:hypothetical protein